MDIIVQDTVYEPGQTIQGLVRPASGHTAHKVKVELLGDAEVKWAEIQGTMIAMYGHVHFVPDLTFREHKRFLDLHQHLSDPESPDIRFSLQLPNSGIPSSYESELGTITYKILVTIEDTNDQVCLSEKVIQVSAPIKQNLLVSVGATARKDFGVLSLGAGRIILEATLSKKGYVAGETIELVCNVDNTVSSVKATPRAILYRTAIYMCGQHHRVVNKALTEPVVGQCVLEETDSSQALNVGIPSDAVLSLKSDLISIKYFIHVTLDIPHAFDIYVNVPIVVTTQTALEAH